MASFNKKAPPSIVSYRGDGNEEAIQALTSQLSASLAFRARPGLQHASQSSYLDHADNTEPNTSDEFYASKDTVSMGTKPQSLPFCSMGENVEAAVSSGKPIDSSVHLKRQRCLAVRERKEPESDSHCMTVTVSDPSAVNVGVSGTVAIVSGNASLRCEPDPDNTVDSPSPVCRRAVLQSQASFDRESSSDKVIDLNDHPDWKPLISSSNADTSSDSSGGVYSTSEEDIDMKRGRPQTQPEESAGGFEGLMCYVLPESSHVNHFVTELRYKQRQSGIYACNNLHLQPAASNQSALEYKEGKHFKVEKIIHHSDYTGVFLCQDTNSGLHFILKKIKSVNHRLVGLEFLTKHRQDFLPKIYGVFKEKDVIWIFQEYIEGGTVRKCDWNLVQIYQFGVRLLTVCKYLHDHGLAHYDIKLMNLMVRDMEKPESLVVIDFESAKHGSQVYQFQKGGYTIFYLPPWHEDIFCLEAFDDILKTADLWAIGCVLIFLLLPSDRSDLQHNSQFLWTATLREIRKDCKSRCEGLNLCKKCRERFLHNLKVNGREILTIHLARMMAQNNTNPYWLALRNALRYLTNCDNWRQKNVDEALRILTDLPRHTQLSIEEDIVIH